MRPYSVDFRQKIIDVWKKEKISIRVLAQRFDVAKSFIQKLLKQHKETGDIRPRRQGGTPPTKWFFVTWYGSIGGHKSTKSLSGKRFN
jgi:transposase